MCVYLHIYIHTSMYTYIYRYATQLKRKRALFKIECTVLLQVLSLLAVLV